MRTIFRRIISSLVFFNLVERYRGKSSLMKIHAAQFYVSGVKKTRFLFLGILFMIFSFVFLGGGLLLIHTALFSYSSWTAQMKFFIALSLGCFEIFVASGILIYLFREETWVKFSGINCVINAVVKKEVKT